METSLAFVLAGGKGDRLSPLTDFRAKPAVPFSRYRIIDHNVSSLINAGVAKIFLLPQYQPLSLDVHSDKAYPHTDMRLEKIVRLAYPREIRKERGETEFAWYLGTAHAVKQNIELIEKYTPDHVLVFAGDHVCSVNVADMLDKHHKEKRDLTIAVEVRQLKESDFEIGKDKQLRYKYGIIDSDKNNRILGFREKPLRNEMGKPGDEVLVSMGNYVFHTDPLMDALNEVNEKFNDFGKNVIPSMLNKKMDLFIYRFNGYWRDVGDVVSYFNACMDLNQIHPPLDYKQLRKEKRPIITEGGEIPPTRFESQGKISTVSEGSEIYGTIENCVLGQNVYIGKGSIVRDSIIFPGVIIEEGVNIRNAIIDKNNTIPRGITIGCYDQPGDRLKQFYTIPKDNDYIAVVPKGLLK
ncbi:MAG: sugar phosphate nucleotidyltransferase [Candidatus Pacearchaeota archaeon]|jgi:glucose-1-phosphate adenylyltransferase